MKLSQNTILKTKAFAPRSYIHIRATHSLAVTSPARKGRPGLMSFLSLALYTYLHTLRKTYERKSARGEARGGGYNGSVLLPRPVPGKQAARFYELVKLRAAHAAVPFSVYTYFFRTRRRVWMDGSGKFWLCSLIEAASRRLVYDAVVSELMEA